MLFCLPNKTKVMPIYPLMCYFLSIIFSSLLFTLLQKLSPYHCSPSPPPSCSPLLPFLLLLLFYMVTYQWYFQIFVVNHLQNLCRAFCFVVAHYFLLFYRSSPVFNAFLSNLSHVLDHNFGMGTVLLPTCLPVLQFCAAPHRVVDLRYPTYSLWCLQPHPRRYWLKSVLIFLYKVQY